MKAFKITYLKKDHAGVWRTMYSIRQAKNKKEALETIKTTPELIKRIEFLGYKKTDQLRS
tara:strand:- start:3173 stop:3352 length:180 start_codon:yes stop_codon:yes gene_type:complete